MNVILFLCFTLLGIIQITASEKNKPFQVPHTPMPYEIDDTLPMTPRDPTMYESIRDKTTQALCCWCIKSGYDDLD